MEHIMTNLIPIETITEKIHVIRNQKVLLDRDLAELYGVETSQLKRAVRRNSDRFPDDFMFELTKKELENWRCHFGTSNSIKMGLRHPPLAFTEQGVAMLSSVLKSKRAAQVNIAIMRAFIKMREIFIRNREFADTLQAVEKQLAKHDDDFKIIFQALRQLLYEEEKPKRKIGF